MKTWWKHLLGRIKRKAKRVFGYDWTLEDFNEHRAYIKWRKHHGSKKNK